MAEEAEPKKVAWPSKATGAGETLLAPTKDLLDGIGLIGFQPVAEGTAVGIIDSAVLDVTEQIKKLILGVGGATAALGGIGSVAAGIKDYNGLAAALAGGVALVLASMVIGLALILNGDVRGRAAVTVEQMRARATVTQAFLESAAKFNAVTDADGAAAGTGVVKKSPEAEAPTFADDLRVALAAFSTRLDVQIEGEWEAVEGVHWVEGRGLRVKTPDDGAFVADVTSFRVGDRA